MNFGMGNGKSNFSTPIYWLAEIEKRSWKNWLKVVPVLILPKELMLDLSPATLPNLSIRSKSKQFTSPLTLWKTKRRSFEDWSVSRNTTLVQTEIYGAMFWQTTILHTKKTGIGYALWLNLGISRMWWFIKKALTTVFWQTLPDGAIHFF